MPLVEYDPYEHQYFKDVYCPPDIKIPILDPDAWLLNPRHSHVYDKLFVAQSQGLEAAPHGVIPPSFPVFSKPISNLLSMGAGSCIIHNKEVYLRSLIPGHFWSTVLTGDHISSDGAVINGKIVWWKHATCFPGPFGTFDYFRIETKAFPRIEEWCEAWALKHLRGYTGMVNFETIENRIIEVHLRFTSQWPDLQGKGYMDAVVNLYTNKEWNFQSTVTSPAYSFIVFGQHGTHYAYPSQEELELAASAHGVSSIQITFPPDGVTEFQSNPPGGARLAIVNSLSEGGGRHAREILKRAIKPITK